MQDNVTEILWKAETLRFTVFPVGSAEPLDAKLLWSLAENGPAEQIVEQPALGFTTAMGKTTIGSQQAALIMQMFPDRIHWIVGADASKGTDSHGMLVVGEFAAYRDIFTRMVLALLKNPSFPPIKRMAFGAVLLSPVKTREEGYVFLDHFLPAVEMDPQNSFEFFYQINRPRKHESSDIFRINRISKWSVGSLQNLTLSLGSGNTSIATKETGVFALRLEMDISTDSSSDARLSQDLMIELFPVLENFGAEISEKGDIP